MKKLIVHEFSLRDRSSRGVMAALRQFASRPTWFCLLLALWVPTAARAATYYVDYASGSDTNNGTSTASAWKHCPGDYAIADVASTAVPSTNQLHSGDTVFFKGGVVYSIALSGYRSIYYSWLTNSGIVINNSGSSGNVITYDGTGNSWGTGRAVIDGTYLPHATAITVSTGVSYFTLNGFEIRNFGGYSDTATNVLSAAAGTYTNTANGGGAGIDCTAGNNTNLTFANLLIDRIGQWRNTIGWDGYSVGGSGIVAAGPNGLIITNCEISKTGGSGVGIYAKPNLLNCLVTDCYFHDNINWAMDVSIIEDGGIINGLTITKTRFLNLNAFGGGFQGPNGDALHQNYLFLRSNGSATPWTNVFVTGCFFGDTNAVLAGVGGTAAIGIGKGPSVSIYNNIFAHSWSITGVIAVYYYNATTTTQIVRIYNNTFYRDCSGACVEADFAQNPGGSMATNRLLCVLNNLFIDTPLLTQNGLVGLNFDPGSEPQILDYNIYYSPKFTAASRYVGAYYTLTNLKTSRNFEAHGFWANPLFNNPASPTLDCTLATNSPAIGAGTNLSAYFATDYAGNPRPTTGPWTIGAFEGGAVQKDASISVTPANQHFGTVAVGTATNQTLTVQNTGGGTLTGSASVVAPFSIVSGGSYSLSAGQSQPVTVSYNPTAAGSNAGVVVFSGGFGASAALSGAAGIPPVPPPNLGVHAPGP